jgi:hypothetical protein
VFTAEHRNKKPGRKASRVFNIVLQKLPAGSLLRIIPS